MTGRFYVIGAGLAGLSAATALAARGAQVSLFEAAGQAGGRCRSYFDPAFGGLIDNGNHLVLSGNKAVGRYLSRIGARDRLAGPQKAQFDFVDLGDGARWSLKPNDGPLPWWVASRSRRVPGSGAFDYAAYARLLTAKARQTIAELVPAEGALWRRLMHPFFLAALNTEPGAASARLAGAVLRETLMRGGRACRPRIAPHLAAAFIEPALAHLQHHGAEVRLGCRLRGLALSSQEVMALEFPDATVPLSRRDRVILAVPAWVAKELIPGLVAPEDHRAIVNGHFQLASPAIKQPAILGVIGGTAEWIFRFADRISVTVSAADAIVDLPREELAERLWNDVQAALGLGQSLPAWQIVKEKRATFAATPAEDAKRPPAATSWRNLVLAGDWTQTGLPATIEGALRSGETAARLALSPAAV
jgi:squalene-associated FAD-dependent desaturase